MEPYNLNRDTTGEIVTRAIKAAGERVSEASLTLQQVHRVADEYLRHSDGEATARLSEQTIRMALRDHSQWHVREVRDFELAPSMMAKHLYSLNEELPEWDSGVAVQISQLPEPRPHVSSGVRRPRKSRAKAKVSGVADIPETPADVPSEARPEVIITLIRQLAADAQDGGTVKQLREENAALRKLATEYESELDEIRGTLAKLIGPR